MLFSKSEKRKTGKSVQQSIPYQLVYPNGVIETESGIFTKAYELEDINFLTAPEAEQERILKAYRSFLNSFSVDVHFQIMIVKTNEDKRNTIDKARILPQRDGLNSKRVELNQVILDKIITAKNSLTQKKYLIISIADGNVAHAMHTLSGIDKTIETGLRAISDTINVRPQTSEERLRTLFDIYNQDGSNVFENDRKNNRDVFTLKGMLKQGLSTKDIIAPTGMEFKSNYFQIGDTYARTFYLNSVPQFLAPDFIKSLTDISARMIFSIHFEPIERANSMRMVKNKLTSIDARIAGRQKQARDDGYGFDIMSPEITQEKKQTLELYDDLVVRDQSLFDATILLTVFADTKEELEYNTRQVISVSKGKKCPMRCLKYLQEQAFNGTLPLEVNNLEKRVKRLLNSDSATAFMPFIAQDLIQNGGIFYGINKATDNVILYNRITGQNMNGLVIGQSGSGKSMFAKLEMLCVRLRSEDNQIYVIDPESEYINMAKALKGEVVELAPTSKTYLNPLDMDIDYDGESDPLAMKTDYILGMIEIMAGGNKYLDPVAKAIVSRCVRNIYRPYLDHLDEMNRRGQKITCDRNSMPTLFTLKEELKRQEEPEAHTIASILESYTMGSMATFAQRTNVDTTKKFVVYDISHINSGQKDLGLHIALNDIWIKTNENAKKGIWTWIYIDEFRLLLQSDSTISFLATIWQRGRKRNCVPTGLLQNTEDIMKTKETRDIMLNSNFVTLMKMLPPDQNNIAEILPVPDSLLHTLTDASSGNGLICAGNSVVPFDNTYSKDSEIYSLVSTSKTKDEYLRQIN